MPLPLLATAEALAGWLGVEFDDDEAEQAEVVLAHASAAVRNEAGVNWVDADGELTELPVGIAELVVRVAARWRDNPTGLRSESTGPLRAEFDGLELTEAERAAIARAMRKPTSGLFVIETTRSDPETATVFLDVEPAGEKMPFLDRGVLW